LLYTAGIAICLSLLGVAKYPPSAIAQDSALNQHLQNTDSNVAANASSLRSQWQRLEDQRKDLQEKLDRTDELYYALQSRVDVMYSNWDLVKWLIGGLVIIFGGQLALTWKQNKAS
jgi:peptidoglycan hydrolase CwlO-like protein